MSTRAPRARRQSRERDGKGVRPRGSRIANDGDTTGGPRGREGGARRLQNARRLMFAVRAPSLAEGYVLLAAGDNVDPMMFQEKEEEPDDGSAPAQTRPARRVERHGRRVRVQVLRPADYDNTAQAPRETRTSARYSRRSSSATRSVPLGAHRGRRARVVTTPAARWRVWSRNENARDCWTQVSLAQHVDATSRRPPTSPRSSTSFERRSSIPFGGVRSRRCSREAVTRHGGRV